MSERFHVNSALAPGRLLLSGPEAHHLGTVCRVRPGDLICLFNGDGREYPARVIEIGRRDVEVEVSTGASPPRELPFTLHLASPLPKGDRADFLVEKLTELGVSVLHLVATSRTVVHPRDSKVERLTRHVIEASKQCGRNVLMQVEAPRPWAEFVRDPSLPATRLLAHRLDAPTVQTWPVGTAVLAAVGPEGGFTESEVAEAVAAGWRLLDLGPRILRMETAAIALAARLALPT